MTELSELEAMCRAAEGAVQLAGSGREALDAELELWEDRSPAAPPGGMAADPERSIAGLRRIVRAPETPPRAAALASMLLARLLARRGR